MAKVLLYYHLQLADCVQRLRALESVSNALLSALSNALDNEFKTTSYLDDKITELHEFTDQDIETLRNEDAVTQLLAWY